LLDTYLLHSSTLKMVPVCPYGTAVNFYRTKSIWHYMTEGSILLLIAVRTSTPNIKNIILID
jgi:hypothetical protein